MAQVKNTTMSLAQKILVGDVCWKKFPGTIIKGLTSLPYSLIDTCIIYCVGTLICNAITHVPEGYPSCFVQLAKAAEHFADSFESSPLATSYILDKVCLGRVKTLSEWLNKNFLRDLFIFNIL